MNTQQRAVVQQALEAFEKLYLTEDDEWARDYVRAQATALRQLLEQPEQADEPVGWMYVNKDCECEQIEYGEPIDDPSITLLYTHPQPAAWVGLTEDEINRLRHLVDWTAEWSYGRFAYELEQLLREKNGGTP